MRGNRTSDEIIMTVEGRFVGYTENSKPKHEKQKAARIIAGIITGLGISPKQKDMSSGTKDMQIPKINEAITSPKTIVDTETGHASSLSSVLICPSHGAITGETEVDAKKTVIESNPAIKKFKGKSLPIQNAKNRNKGSRIPKMTTGPFR